MPCCAFAACIVAQLILGARAVKRAVLGRGGVGCEERNAAVEWRLDATSTIAVDLTPTAANWYSGRRSLRVLVLAAAFELVIVLGAIYGIVEHLGHGHGHEHAGHVEARGAHD